MPGPTPRSTHPRVPSPDLDPLGAAQWMLDEVRRQGALDHVAAVEHLLAAAPRLVKWNREGRAMIRTSVLRAFRRIRGLDIIWSPQDHRWRTRRPDEPPPRPWRR